MNEKQVVIISGGSRGLGQAMVKHCMDQGYIVATFSRSETDFIKEMRSKDADAKSFYWEAVNATDLHALKQFAFNVYRKYRRIDGLVNNAGSNLDQLLSLTSDKDIDRILSLNLESVIHMSRHVSRIMLKQNDGVILNVSSIIGLRGYKGTSVYSASKAALDAFSRSLARELGSRNIRVNSIAPGFMDTDMTQEMSEKQKAQIIRRTPLGRLGKVTDVTGLVTFLFSKNASFITGQTFVVDGGLIA